MQKSSELVRSVSVKRLKPLSDTLEWKDFMEALKAAKSEPAFKEAIAEFRKKHTSPD